MKIEDVSALDIKGFLDHEEGMLLYDIARESSANGPCLEIGGYCGKSTVYLGLGCKARGGILFSIDHHRGSEEQQKGQEYFDPELYDEASGRVDTFRHFRRTVELASLEDTVVPIVARSEVVARMWSTPLSAVFIDGGHSYPTVFTDYTSWMPHVVPGGYLLIHDIFPDPNDGGQARIMSISLRSSRGSSRRCRGSRPWAFSGGSAPGWCPRPSGTYATGRESTSRLWVQKNRELPFEVSSLIYPASMSVLRVQDTNLRSSPTFCTTAGASAATGSDP